MISLYILYSVCVCVCYFWREREREKKREMTVVKQMYKEKRSGMKSSRASRCRKWKSASVQRGEKVRAVDAQRQDYCASDNASNGEKWLAPELDTSDMCASLNESKTVQLTDLAMALRRKGVNVVAMTAGEPDFATPEPICAAAHAAMEAGRTGYPPNAGLGALREAICDKLRDDNGLDYSPADIVVSGGAKQSCAQAVLATCGPGDEVIVPCPHWVSYPEVRSRKPNRYPSLSLSHACTSDRCVSLCYWEHELVARLHRRRDLHTHEFPSL